MAKRQKLTNRFIADLSNDSKKAIHFYDTEVRGFCVTVTPNQTKSFYYVGRINGRSRRVMLGPFPEMTATEARQCCRETIVEAAKGQDISSRKASHRRTLGELFNLYLTVHAKPNKRTWKSDVRDFERFCNSWKARPVVEIRRGHISDLVATIAAENGPGPAHKCRALLSKMFNIAIKHEWVEFNPVTGTDRPQIESRDRYLRPEEIERFFEAVEQLQRETSRDFIKLAVFTGARRSNLCEMRWEELDLNRGVWTIPKEKFKGKRVHTVPLIPQALEILRKRKADAVSGVPWVFPTGSKAGHMMDPKAAMQRVKELSGIKDLRFHDLRRTMGAWQNNNGVPTRMIQSTLGHADIATTAAAYSPSEVEPIRAAMIKAVNAMQKK
ncbi:tyrosine-type recombinase/integrase [Thalassoglobus sp.]|uniref:tyrosine-type recombinase/integrase n=1 Tax=Thalassoglobus sp. TaxID=2795869 RepID=UPI003AA8413D